MKKIFLPLMLLTSVVSSCGYTVTPVSYVRYQPSSTEYVYYSSYMYGDVQAHINIYNGQPSDDDGYKHPLITFNFDRILGIDTVEDVKYTLAEYSTRFYSLSVTINKKDNPFYEDSKWIYLNGARLELEDRDDVYYDSEYTRTMFFVNYGLIRTNSTGQLDYTKVNVLEYK